MALEAQEQNNTLNSASELLQFILNMKPRSGHDSDMWLIGYNRCLENIQKLVRSYTEPKADEDEIDVEELLLENGYEGVMYFTDYTYNSALIGISHDDRAVYDYDEMVMWLMRHEGMTEEEAMDWISYNTIRSLDYAGDNAPIVVFPLIH